MTRVFLVDTILSQIVIFNSIFKVELPAAALLTMQFLSFFLWKRGNSFHPIKNSDSYGAANAKLHDDRAQHENRKLGGVGTFRLPRRGACTSAAGTPRASQLLRSSSRSRRLGPGLNGCVGAASAFPASLPASHASSVYAFGNARSLCNACTLLR